jgi:hypothetical protein
MTGAELAARTTMARAILADFRHTTEAEASATGQAVHWPVWAARLAIALGKILDQLDEEAPARASQASSGRCAACGIAAEPLEVTRFRGIGEEDWQELWRCADVRACHDRIFPELAALLDGSDDLDHDGTEPYCLTCREWAGMFLGLEGWHHFRGDPAPGGQRTLYEADHEAVIGWIVPPGRGLSPAGLDTLRQALADAIQYRDPSGACADCEVHPAGLCEDHGADLDRTDTYLALARQLGIEADR